MLRLPNSLWVKWLVAFLILAGLTLIAHPILQYAREQSTRLTNTP